MKRKSVQFVSLWVTVMLFLCGKISGQDTVNITIDKADSAFLVNNLSLLSAKYSISAAQALKIQAKVYPNPTLYLEQSLVNKNTRSNYDTDPTRTGSTENIVQVNQLITLAGKRNKQIKLADINIKLTETDFENPAPATSFRTSSTDSCGAATRIRSISAHTSNLRIV